MTNRTLTTTALALALAFGSVSPAFADGAASTRNILIGGAAAAAGTLLIINHNKQVHQRYADDARRQADTQAQANNAQAAYAAERRAYDNERTVNSEYAHEVATQHSLIVSLRTAVAVEKARADHALAAGKVQPAVPVASAPHGSDLAHPVPVAAPAAPLHVASTSWGWGQF
jgi:hypothetical protein